MELLSQGAMVERFERKKMAVKSKLNELVDDLFAFMLSEVTTIVPPALHPVMATSGGATITVVPSSSSSTLLPPTSKSSTPAASAPPSGSGTISAPSAAAAGVNNAVIGNGLGATTFTMLKPVSKPATAHLAMKVKEEIREEEDFEEEDEDDEEDEYDDEDEDDDHHHQHRTTNIGRASLGILSKAALSLSQRSQSAVRSQQQLQSAAAGSSGHSNQGNHGSNHHHHHHHHHHNHNHRNHPNSSGFCDSDDDSCECYDCMDESMVKVEMEMENDDSDSDNLGKHFYASSEGGVGPKRKRQKTFAERRAASGGTGAAGVGAAGSAIADLDSGGGGGGPSDINENLDDDDESESVSNNHQIDTLGLQCWLPGCKAMLEDRAKLNQHLYFEHDKTLPYQCRVIGCGRQFDVRKDFWHHIRTGHVDFTCSICSIKFNGYFPFITHEFQQHEEGIFKCSREDCDFVAAIRDLVYKHAKTEHVKFVCTFAGCEATFECYSYLKRHRRIHSQVKPYRCKWPGCGYSSTQCGAVIQHIRIRHFKLPSSVKKQKELNIVDHRNPNDYLQVITELLN